MNRLKTILQSKWLYLIILAFSLIYLFIYINILPHERIYKDYVTDYFTIYQVKDDQYFLQGKEKIICYLKDKSYNPGDILKITMKEIKIYPNKLPNTFNYENYLYHNHIKGVYEAEKITFIKESNNIIYKIRSFLLNRLNLIPNSKSFVGDLLFNTKDNLDLYKEAGISHLFAISGMHISFLILILKKLFKNKYLFDLFFLFFLFSYLLILNFPVSLFRVFLFFMLTLINKNTLKINNIYIFMLMVSIMLFIDPFYVYNIGFLLSIFLSLFLLICPFKNFILINIICLLVSIPIIYSINYEIDLTIILNNLISIPLVTFIFLPLSILTFIFPFLDPLLSNLIYLFRELLQFLSIFKLNIILPKINLPLIISYYLLLFLSLKHSIKLIILSFIFILLWSINPFNKKDQIVYIDVGQGDSTMLYVNNFVTLIDTGGIYSQDDDTYTYPLAKNLITYLKSLGISKIDNLFLTHGDLDHIKDSIYLIDHLKIGHIYLNDNQLTTLEEEVILHSNKSKVPISKMHHLAKVESGSTFINYGLSYENENDSSLILYTKINGYSFLFPGDASSLVLDNLINEIGKIDILKLAHHGSSTSNSIYFLKRTSPKMTIISSSLNNKYHLPSYKVINNLNTLNIPYLNTSIKSSIFFDLKKGTFSFM